MTKPTTRLRRNVRAAARGAGVACIALLAGIAGAAANDVCEGTVSGQALKPLPAGAAFDMDIYDNSDANLALRDRFRKALKDAGLPVADGGPLMVSVISERLFPRYRADERAVGAPTTRATNEHLGVNRTRSTIEQMQRAPGDVPPVGENRRYEEQVGVRFEVRDTATHDFIWLGQLSCSPLTDSRSRIVDTVFDAFVRNVGKTVTDAPL